MNDMRHGNGRLTYKDESYY